MSDLIKLLEGVKVDWIYLGELAELKRGTTITAKSKSDGDIPVISGGQKPAYYNDKFNRENETLTIAGSGAYAGFVSYWNEPIFVADAFSIKPSKDLLNTLYIYHILKSKQNMIYKLKKGVGVPHVYPKDLGKFLIPIPCPDNPEKSLKIQQEIVRILDRLSEETNQLNAALQKELNLHQKQYNFYREELFKFEGKEVGWKKISEIGKFQRGKRFVRTDMISEGVPCIHYGEMYTHYGISAVQSKSYLNREFALAKKLRVADKGDVVIVAAGETVEDIGKGTAWLGDEGVVIHDACFSYKSPLNPTYFAYFTRTSQYHDQIKRNISSGKISAINEKGFSSVIIPVPSPEEQNRIVKILDNLDAKTKDITKAIQKEITLRNKQYKYYRDRLLSFSSLHTEAEAIQ